MKTTVPAMLITNCTGRKLHKGGASVLDLTPHIGSIDGLAIAWRAALDSVGSRHIARDLYGGRAIREAEAAATFMGAPLYVVSAGLGLISVADVIPAYDLTVAATGATLLPTLGRLGLTPKDWWRALNGNLGDASPIAALIKRHPGSVTYIAMPATYLNLIADELAALPALDRHRLRIITSPAWQREASPALVSQSLPYDERLESTSFAGTRADFPQRALRHFVQALGGNALSIEDGRAVVAEAMTMLTLKVLPERRRCTDIEICSLLRQHWKSNGGSSSRLLRVLRDDLLIKCEQTRFRDLWRSIHAEMESSTS